jgi:hypothetical protein
VAAGRPQLALMTGLLRSECKKLFALSRSHA